MTLDIIDDNYLSNHKYSYVWWCFLLVMLIIYLLQITDLIELTKSHDSIFRLATIIVGLVTVFSQFIFTRIGKLELIKSVLVTRVNDDVKTIDLNTIETVRISSTNKNQYFLKFNTGSNILVEMKKEQLLYIKQIFIKNKIKVIDTRLLFRLKKLFTKQ